MRLAARIKEPPWIIPPMIKSLMLLFVPSKLGNIT